MGVDHPGLPMSVADLMRDVRRLAKATLQNASIGRAGIRVYDGGWIRIEDGGLSVTGTADVSGYLNVTGTLTGSGTFSWSGPLNISGPLDVLGTWKLTGDGQITGDVNVTGDITVLPGGKIKVGNIVIDPTISGGAIVFANGAQVFTDGSTIQVYKGNSVVQIANDYARLQNGGNTISIGTDGVRITGAATIQKDSVPGSFVGALASDASGYVRRVIA